MNFRYTLPERWVAKVSDMDEFANGGVQVTVKTKDGKIFPKVLVSNSKHLVAARGYKDLPFSVDQITDICQSDEDRNPSERGNWDFWDDWRQP